MRRESEPKTPLSREVLERLYVAEGLSCESVAARTGWSSRTVWLRINEYGMQRTLREARKAARKPVQTPERLAQLRESAAYARSKVTEESRKKQGAKKKGQTSPNKGKKMSEEQRAKLKAAWTPERKKHMSAMFLGEKAPNWKGGNKPLFNKSLDTAAWRRIRQEVYRRDDWKCQDCGVQTLSLSRSRAEPKRRVQAHHIIARRNGGTDELSNLVTLCMSCHHKREGAARGRLFA